MSTTKIGKKATNILKLLFYPVNSHFVTSIQISTYRKLNLPLIRSIYFVFLPLEMHKRLKYTTRFLTLSEKNDQQTFKSGSCKNPFLQCVCYWYNLLRWMFFILSDNWNALLFMKSYFYSEIFLSAMLFWKMSVFYASSPQ